MRKFIGALVVAYSLAGCGELPSGPGYPKKPDQESAVAILVNAYHMEAQPEIEWIEGDRLDCDSPGTFSVAVGRSHVCVGGWTYSDAFMQVSWLPGYKFSKLRLAHEFKHADLFLYTGSGEADPVGHGNDSGPIWGIPDGEVGRANAALDSAGL